MFLLKATANQPHRVPGQTRGLPLGPRLCPQLGSTLCPRLCLGTMGDQVGCVCGGTSRDQVGGHKRGPNGNGGVKMGHKRRHK